MDRCRKMASALRNLLSNAFKYTLPEGTVELVIGRTVIDGHPFCNVTISDTGAGIPQEVKEHLFEPFTTGVNTPIHSTQTGIGMRIVKNIVDLHHGYIRTADRPGHGTIISLYIPEGNTHFDTTNEKVSLYKPAKQPQPATTGSISDTADHNHETGKGCLSSKTMLISANTSAVCSKESLPLKKQATVKKASALPTNKHQTSLSAIS